MLLRDGYRLEFYAVTVFRREVSARPPETPGQAFLLPCDTCENPKL